MVDVETHAAITNCRMANIKIMPGNARHSPARLGCMRCYFPRPDVFFSSKVSLAMLGSLSAALAMYPWYALLLFPWPD